MKKLLALALCALVAGQAEARTLYVDASRPNNNGNGLKAQTAKRTIQAAINIAKNGDTILVLPGTYSPIKTNNKKITIKSSKGKSKTTIKNTAEGNVAVALLGKTWSIGGYVGSDGYEIPKESSAPFSRGTDTTLAGFVLDGGYAGSSYGVQLGVSGGSVKSATIQRIGLKNGGPIKGGAARGSKLTSCLITGNRFIGSGWGLVRNCTLNQCKITGNEGSGSGSLASDSTLVNTLVAQNINKDCGFDCSTLLNCTVADNESRYQYSALELAYGSKFCNCILFNNKRRKASLSYDGITVKLGAASVHNASKGNTYTNTNKTNKDPKFVNAAKGNYKLRNGSYCINSGKLTASQKKTVGSKDLAGNQRIKGKAVDRGCYEY